jgi:putative ABC transport system permease protein
LDNNAARTLFRSDDPIGQTIEIKGEPFTIIGLVRKSNDFKPDIETVQDYYTYQGQGQSGQVMIHDACWPILYRFDEPQCVSVKAVNTDAMTKVGKSTADLLNSSLGLPLSDASAGAGGVVSTDMAAVDTIGGADAEVVDSGDQSQSQGIQYQNEDLLEQAKQLQEMSNATNRMLIWIASISLLVGGIGVMNIMLVSVTERTREIGLKKAIGARKGRILGQFLTEAAVLTSLGGLFGVVIGMILAKVISTVNGTLYAISIPAIIVSVVFSMVIGIVFGLLPSIKAANLNPIDALRYE